MAGVDAASVSSGAEGATKKLASFLARTSFADVPKEVFARSAHISLDGIACALVGASLPWSSLALEAVAALDGPGPAPVFGRGISLPPSSAALLNGTFIQGFELDDYHELGPLHSA